jgi:hypothetical protein
MIMTSEDIALAKRKREEKEAAREAKRRKKSASTSEMGHTLPHAGLISFLTLLEK